MSTPGEEMLVGLAQLIAAAGIATYADSYTDPQVGIVFGDRFAQSPSQQVVLRLYPVRDVTVLGESIVGIEVQFRGTTDPVSVQNLADRVFDLLQTSQVTLGTVHVLNIWRVSGGPTGVDGGGRALLSNSYYAYCDWPTAQRPD